MYHYTNQPVYHHDEYHQCVFFDQGRTNNVRRPDGTEYHSTVLNIVTDSTHKADQHIVKTQDDKIKKPDINKTLVNNVDTSNFSIEERLIAAVWVHERKSNKTSMSQIKNNFKLRFGREPPAKNTLLAWARKLFSTGSVCDSPRPGRPINRHVHIGEVSASVRAAPALSLRARALALRLPRTTLRAVLRDLRPPAPASSLTGKRASRKSSKRARNKPTTRHASGASAPALSAPPALGAPSLPPLHPQAPTYTHELTQAHDYT